MKPSRSLKVLRLSAFLPSSLSNCNSFLIQLFIRFQKRLQQQNQKVAHLQLSWSHGKGRKNNSFYIIHLKLPTYPWHPSLGSPRSSINLLETYQLSWEAHNLVKINIYQVKNWALIMYLWLLALWTNPMLSLKQFQNWWLRPFSMILWKMKELIF